MDLKVLVLLSVIMFISIEALPRGGGRGGGGRGGGRSGGGRGVSRGGGFRGVEDGDGAGSDDLEWLWITLCILGFTIFVPFLLICVVIIYYKFCSDDDDDGK